MKEPMSTTRLFIAYSRKDANLLDELKKSRAFELSLFSKATIPEKYLDKILES